MSFDRRIQSCNLHHNNQNLEHFHYHPKSPLCPFYSQSLPATTDLTFILVVLLFPECHINGILCV